LIQADDVEWEQVATLSDRGDAVASLEALAGQETTRALRSGDTLHAPDIHQVPLIRRGDIVTVYARRTGISVRMEAKSQSEGTAGESVTLLTLDGRQKLYATVTGYHQAEVTRSRDDRPAASSVAEGTSFESREEAAKDDQPASAAQPR
jgi:flagella basal body P-ring formation protein FlgA